jgi:hypothetical protein
MTAPPVGVLEELDGGQIGPRPAAPQVGRGCGPSPFSHSWPAAGWSRW